MLLFDRVHQRVRIGGFGHFVYLRIGAVAQRREIALQLVDDLQNLGHFLFGQEIDLQIEVRAVFGHPRHAVLPDEHGDRQQ